MMNKKELKGTDTFIFHEELSNGLNVYLLPFPNKKNYFMSYFTKFGSINIEFVPNGEKKEIKVPLGIAHFLEHKMFEQEDGEVVPVVMLQRVLKQHVILYMEPII